LFVYLDESGDLGFTKKASRFCIIAHAYVDTPFRLETAWKRKLRKLHQRHKYSIPEFKFSRASRNVRLIFLKLLAEHDISFGLVVLEKELVYQRLRDDPNMLYRYVVIHPLMDSLYNRLETYADITIDKSLNRNQINDFQSYANLKAGHFVSRQKLAFRIKHRNSQDEPVLQVSDCVAGAAFSHYERQNSEYLDIIQNMFSYENYMWR
jgi:hypothetical protein